MGIFDRKQTIYLMFELLKRPLYRWYIKRRASLGKDSAIFGKPIIINKGYIKIGNNVKMISSSKFYGEGIFPVSLYTINSNSKITIGNNCTLQGTSLRCAEEIIVGDNVVFAGNVKIIDHDHYLDLEKRNAADYPSKPIVIEDDVWFGYNVTVLKGVRIGRGSVIGAHSLVTKDIPEMSVAAGNPAKVLRKI